MPDVDDASVVKSELKELASCCINLRGDHTMTGLIIAWMELLASAAMTSLVTPAKMQTVDLGLKSK